MTAMQATVGWVRGRALRLATRAGTATRAVPGAVGALMLAWGFGQIYAPLMWITLGLFALAIDREL